MNPQQMSDAACHGSHEQSMYNPGASAAPVQAADAASAGPGDAPGSPAYYGASKPAAPAERSDGARPALSAVGLPPGCAAYYGASGPAGGDRRQHERQALAPAAVGEPPGSAAYYGSAAPPAAADMRAASPAMPAAAGQLPGRASSDNSLEPRTRQGRASDRQPVR